LLLAYQREFLKVHHIKRVPKMVYSKKTWISILKWLPKGSPKMSKGFPGTMECSPSSFGDNVDDFPRPLPFPYKNASQFDILSVIINSPQD